VARVFLNARAIVLPFFHAREKGRSIDRHRRAPAAH
jgi:hypothetical protein